MNLKKAIPLIAILIYGYLVATWILKGNYVPIAITFLPVFIFAAIALVLKGTYSKNELKDIKKTHAHVRDRDLYILTLILMAEIGRASCRERV